MARRQSEEDKANDDIPDAAKMEAADIASSGGNGSAAPQENTPPPPAVAGGTQPRAEPRPVTSMQQFMVAPIPGAELFRTMDAGMLSNTIAQIPGVEFVRSVVPGGMAAMQTAEMPPVPPVHVYRMGPDRARSIAEGGRSQLVVEVDEPVTLADMMRSPFGGAVRDPGVIFPMDVNTAFTTTIEVRGDDRPLANASVFLYGSVFPVQGVTGADGRVTLTLFNDTAETIRGIVVKPQANYWSRSVARPRLDAGGVNLIAVRPLSDTLANFPAKELLGWGQKLMRLDQVPAECRGKGVRVAIVDSGAATTHPDLDTIARGVDVQSDRPQDWNQDSIGHGSHCAGIICGSTRNGIGIRGFAPDAEVHVVKVFPRGHFSDIAAALDHCMAQDVDIISLSLGSDGGSDILVQRFAKARSLGIACIVAAGNSGGPVLFPARLPGVLAVSAMGQWGEFPEDSHHASQAMDASRRSGPFSASFTCFGPEVGVVGPGVAIVSTVPPDGYVAMDGTSMAAPHITGLAALVLAHHPAFRTTHTARNSARVDALFRIIKDSARPMTIGDATRTGAGLPDAVCALGLEAGAPAAALPVADDGEAIRRLVQVMIEAALAGRTVPATAPVHPMQASPLQPPSATTQAAALFATAPNAGRSTDHPLLTLLRSLR